MVCNPASCFEWRERAACGAKVENIDVRKVAVVQGDQMQQFRAIWAIFQDLGQFFKTLGDFFI